MQQRLALRLFHSDILCKASTENMSVENQHRLNVSWRAMIKFRVRHVTTKSRNKVGFFLLLTRGALRRGSWGGAREAKRKKIQKCSITRISYHDPSCKANLMSAPVAEWYEKWQSMTSLFQFCSYIYYLLLNKILLLFWVLLCLVFFACLSRAGFRLVFCFTHCRGQCCHCHSLIKVLSVILLLMVFFVRGLNVK